MTIFKYRAISKDGKKINGVVEAYDEFDAISKIKQSGAIVDKIDAVKEASDTKGFNINDPLSISEKSLALISSQFAILLRSGLPTARAVEVIAQQTSDKYLKKVLFAVAKDVQAGYKLSTSLREHGKLFPAVFFETINAGEESGTLDKSFSRLSSYFEKSYKLKGKVRGAMIYPLFLIVLAVAVVIVVIKVAVPTLSSVIVDSGGELPLPTKMLIGIYNFSGQYGLLLLGFIALIIIALILWTKTEKGKLKSSVMLLKLPVLGNINLMNAASQFASSMTTLLASGLPLVKALTITGKVMDNYAAGTDVSNCASGIEEGRSLGSVLKSTPYLPSLLTEMTEVGEQSGSLEETLTTIGQYYDSEVEQSSAKALGMLEPAITVIMGICIGFIVIALYLPMFTMYT